MLAQAAWLPVRSQVRQQKSVEKWQLRVVRRIPNSPTVSGVEIMKLTPARWTCPWSTWTGPTPPAPSWTRCCPCGRWPCPRSSPSPWWATRSVWPPHPQTPPSPSLPSSSRQTASTTTALSPRRTRASTSASITMATLLDCLRTWRRSLLCPKNSSTSVSCTLDWSSAQLGLI